MAAFEKLIIPSLDEGMVSSFPVTTIPQDTGFTRAMMNFDFDEIPGVVRKRFGIDRLFPLLDIIPKGAVQFLESGISPKYIVAASNKVLSIPSSGVSWTAIQPVGWSLSTATTCSFASILGVLIVSDGVNTPFSWDGTTATELTNMPKARFLGELNSRVFAAGVAADPLAIHGSHVGDPSIWDSTDTTKNAFKIYPGGEGAITSITTIEDIILIGKKYSLHALVGTTIYDFQVIPVDTTIGIGSHWTVKHIRGSAFFVSSEGEVFRVEAGARPERLSGPIQDIIRTVNLSRIEEARGAVMERYHYVVTLPVGDTSFVTLIYDIIRRRWRMSDLHMGTTAVSEEVLGFCFTKPGGKQLYQLNPDSTEDVADPIEAYIETIEYHFGAPKAVKEIGNLWIGLWLTDEDLTLHIEGRFDNGEWVALTPVDGTIVEASFNSYKQLEVHVGRSCYNAQFRIKNNSTKQQVRLLDIIISYDIKEMD